MKNKIFYIYRHIRKDTNEVFYVGKGTVQERYKTFLKRYYRGHNHTNRSKYWKRIVAITDYEVEIIFESSCEKEVFEKEIEFIKLYGRKDLEKGTLINFTDGGEGESGKIVSEHTRKLLSKAKTGLKYSKETNAKKASHGKDNPMYGVRMTGKDNHFYGKKHSEETVKNHFRGQNNPMSTRNRLIRKHKDEFDLLKTIEEKESFINSKIDFNKINKVKSESNYRHSEDFLRRKQITQSFEVVAIVNSKVKHFECVTDCSNFFECTPENIYHVDKRYKNGLKPRSGKFKSVYLYIIR